MVEPTIPFVESLFNKAKDYTYNRLQLLRLKAIDKSASVVSSIVLGVVWFVVFFIFFVVLNIGIALLIGHFVGGAHWGFLIWAGFYLIVGLVVFSMAKKLIKKLIIGMLIKKFL